MAAVEATFSVNVNKIVEGKNPQSVIKNTIRRISKTNTWFDLFDFATDTLSEDTLPRYAWDHFEKMASVSVSSSPSGEQFNVDPYEKIHVLSDFNSSLKYVTINLKLEATDINNNSEKSGQQNALSLLIAARTATKKAKPLDASGPKFTVMRLTKPTLMPYHPLISDQRDVTSTLSHEVMKADISKPDDLSYFGVSDLLTLPQNFGNIFLGETFASYISVHNDSNQKCSEILLKVDLQTSSQRLLLTGVNTNPSTELKPEQSIDDVIQHEVKELGTHILVCAVSYTTEGGEKMAFRKFFKFQVLKPLDVKTKFYNAESDDVYLEAQIQNITPGPVYMEHVRLDPSTLYLGRDLNSLEKKQGSGQVFGKVDYLNPMDTRQYLYCLSPKPELYRDTKVLKGVTNIGKLDIVWKTNLGEKGRLQTSQLQRVAPGYGDIKVTVEKVADTVPLETTFSILLRITNCCERSMDLTLVLQNDMNSGLLWCGLSGKQLGSLPQNESMDLPLTLITTIPGLQTISGLRLTDNFLKRTYEHDELAQVFVYNDSS